MIEDHSKHIIRRFFAPSALSGFFSVLLGLVLVALSIYYFVINKGGFRDYYDVAFTATPQTTDQLVRIDEAINNNPLAADSAVFMFWVVVGMLFYIAGEIIYRSYKSSQEFVDEMNHTTPKGRPFLLKEGFQHVAFRLLGIIGVYLLYRLLLFLLPPIVLNIYQLIRIDEIWPVILILFGAFALGIVAMHWLTLCLRLLVYRIRVVGSVDS